MDLLEPGEWSFPVPILYGPGRVDELVGVCTSVGMTNPLVVTDRSSAHLPFITRAIDDLRRGGLRAELFSGISPNPVDHDIIEGRDAFVEGSHDGVIAIGGGSGMDGGKAISLIANNDNPLWAFDFDAESSPTLATPPVPLICIPTTAGTGAETESTAMVTDPKRGVKLCVWHPEQHPAAVILDPELTLGLPADLTAWTGIDALVHAIEAYSVADWHPMCDGLALEAIHLIWHALPVAVEDGSNIEARAAMLTGSCLAGVSFLKGLGLVHAMSHMVGAVYDTHHGLTNAVLLPPVLEFNREHIGSKTARMAQAMGLADTSHDSFAHAIQSMLSQLDIPDRLSALGVEEDRLNELAHKSLADAAAATNPRAATVKEIEALLTARL